MTAPSLPPAALSPFGLGGHETQPPVEPAAPTIVPALWILREGAGPVVHRTLSEFRAGSTAGERGLRLLPYSSRTGWHLLMMQDSDGTWPAGMLSTPSGQKLTGVGTIPAYRRLLEFGWDPECPALACTKRILFRLLAEDNDPSLLYELGKGNPDEDMVARGRTMLREAAAAALAAAGYESDPRLRGAARRMVERLGSYLRSPLAQKPWIRIGNQHVLAADVRAPSFHLLVMLAHMPRFRSEHHEVMDRLYTHVSQPWPRQHVVQQVGAHIVDQPHLVLGDFVPTRNAMDADMPSSLAWLEIMARLGFLARNENWTRLLDRLLDDRDKHGVWHPPRSVAMPDQVPAWSWPVLPLSDSTSGMALSADVSFRLGLIAKLAGRTIDVA